MKFKSLQDIAGDICVVYLNDAAMHKQSAVVRAISIVMNELGLHIETPVRSRFFKIPASFTIAMPNDCLAVTKVGKICDGNFVIMARDEKVYRATAEPLCGCGESDTCSLCTFHNVIFPVNMGPMSLALGEAYGYKGDQYPNGEYKYDKSNNLVMFSSGDHVYEGSEVLIEYHTATNSQALNLIPAELTHMIASRVSQIIEHGRGNRGKAADHNSEFRNSYSALIRRWNRFTPEELVAALMGESMSAPKN